MVGRGGPDRPESFWLGGSASNLAARSNTLAAGRRVACAVVSRIDQTVETTHPSISYAQVLVPVKPVCGNAVGKASSLSLDFTYNLLNDINTAVCAVYPGINCDNMGDLPLPTEWPKRCADKLGRSADSAIHCLLSILAKVFSARTPQSMPSMDDAGR